MIHKHVREGYSVHNAQKGITLMHNRLVLRLSGPLFSLHTKKTRLYEYNYGIMGGNIFRL